MTSSWTDARTDKLRLMCASAERPSAGDMGIQLGVSRNTIIGKVARLGLMLPNHGSHNLHLGAQPRKQSTVKPRPERKTRFYAPPTQPDTTPEPVDPPIPFDGKGVTLFELEERSCRWPNGTPGEDSFRFCGGMSVEGMSYCSWHSRVAYQPHLASRRTYIPARRTPA